MSDKIELNTLHRQMICSALAAYRNEIDVLLAAFQPVPPAAQERPVSPPDR